MSDQNAKQQIIDQLKDVENVLVTVNRNPTVDELSAALGITLLINKLGKHATAVFSGDIPPAITFLDPVKTFENTVDSLRDFIIALDKEKADHLRYKVDGDMVKIFITPYRTTISDQDLDFSQGDYNVEMVIAIGVQDEGDLDRALTDHGRIMHDATVAAVNNGNEPSKIGTINWDDARASSYSEMFAGLSDGLRTDKNLIDEQIATAFLTGIVAATERFSNDSTTSQVMTVAAELMAAGANQQLIASKLEEAHEISHVPDASASDAPKDDGSHLKVNRSDAQDEPAAEPVKDEQGADGTMSVSHEMRGDLDSVALQTLKEQQEEATTEAEEALAESLATSQVSSPNKLSVADLQSDLRAAAEDIDQSIEPPVVDEAVLPAPAGPVADSDIPADEPTFGGILNATSEQAADDKRRQESEDRNKSILSHDGSQYVGNPPATLPPLNSYTSPTKEKETSASDDLLGGDAPIAKAPPVEPSSDFIETAIPTSKPAPAPDTNPAGMPTLAEIDQQNRGGELQDAQAAISQALNQPDIMPSAPAVDAQPAAGLPPLPPMPDFSTLPPLPSDNNPFPPVSEPTQTPEEQLSNVIEPPQAPPLPPASTNADPGQFRIPGQ